MDPLLVELFEEGVASDEVEVILKLKPGEPVPTGVRVVAEFGPIATCRLARGSIPDTHAHPSVLSVKAPRLVGVGELPDIQESPLNELPPIAPRAVAGATGHGTVIGFIDWGFDFAHPNLRRTDGRTRLIGLWDQASASAPGLAPYGYGAAYSANEIDTALAAPNPYRALGYHPSASDPLGTGSHGTHVADIAAGGGHVPGSVRGVAPDADLVFVHLAARGTAGLSNLGDTVRILEALDFIAKTAGERPWVANLSIGRCGGPHDGRTLVEQGIDALLEAAPGRAVVQSTGNYHAARTHAHGLVRPGQVRTLSWEVDKADVTPNEMEIWYAGRDRFLVEIEGPGNAAKVRIPLDDRATIVVDGREVGRAYHRAFDRVNGDHHIDILLDPAAPAGVWRVSLFGEDLVDGRFHAWVERDAACPGCQSRLSASDARTSGTTGTICNGFRSIAVGAFDGADPRRALAPFSSRGPTRDGRRKPDLVAPGVRVIAARSLPDDLHPLSLLTAKSGTSMAAPHVAGTVACMFEVARRPLSIGTTRHLLLGGADPSIDDSALDGIGSGFLNSDAAVRRARASNPEDTMPSDAYENDALEEGADFDEDMDDSDIDDGEMDDADVDDGAINVAAPAFARVPARTPERSIAAASDFVRALLRPRRGPAWLFDAIRAGQHPGGAEFILVAGPNVLLARALEPGDVLLRRATGERGTAHAAVVTSGMLIDRGAALRAGLDPERAGAGGYVQVADLIRPERGRRARRISDPRGRVANGVMILRVHQPRFPRVSYESFGIGEQQVPPGPQPAPAPVPPPPPPFGGYDLILGDRDAGRRWGGRVRNAPADIMPAPGQPGFVEQLQTALREVGILLVTAPVSRVFDERTRQAVRELQLHGKMGNVAQSTGPVVAGGRYSDTLVTIVNPARYGGAVSGVLNTATRTLLDSWVTNQLRCPVVIEAWTIRNGAPHCPRHANLWHHRDLANTVPRMFAIDFSDRYTFPAGRVATQRQVLGDFVERPGRDPDRGGPQSIPPNHTWSEAEILPTTTLFPAATAPGSVFPQLTADQQSSFRVLRAVSEVECIGFYDSINSWDNVFVSMGHFHTPLGEVGRDGGELGAVLSLFQEQDPAAFDELFGFCGMRPQLPWNGNGAALFSAGGQRRFASRTEVQTETGFAVLPRQNNAANRNIYHWFRSWHWFYRFAMAARTSAAFQRSMWAYARIRLRGLLSTPWDGAMMVRDPVSGAQRRATIGDFYTSEQAVALVLRWHVRRPADMATGGLAGPMLRSAFRRSLINLPGDPLAWALADEAALVDGLFAELQALIAASAGTAGQQKWLNLQSTMTNVRNWPVWAPRTINPSGGQRNIRGFTLDPATGPLSNVRTVNTPFPLDTGGLTPAP